MKPIFENIFWGPKGGAGQFLGAFLDDENFSKSKKNYFPCFNIY
jgi:hypothetical protein